MSSSEQNSWYYYLAEIAARHLINRILQAQKSITFTAPEETIEHLKSQKATFESQLLDWYQSLPPPVLFLIPTHEALPLESELCHYLRGRFLTIQELLHRPFVYVCTRSCFQIPEHLFRYTTQMASRGLQLALLRIQSATTTLHHGLWFYLRNFLSCSLILIAANQAQKDPTLNSATGLVLPADWSQAIIAKRQQFLDNSRTQTTQIRRILGILDWALNEFQM